MMPSLQKLADEVHRESMVLEESLSIWRRPIGKTQLRKERSVLTKKYGRARVDRAVDLLEQLHSLMCQCRPSHEEIRGCLDVGQETALTMEKFEKIMPGVPDKVLQRLDYLYAFYAR